MHRSNLLRLVVLAGALTLAAGIARPALAQAVAPGGDQTPIQGFLALPRDKAVVLTWTALTNALGYNVYRRNPGDAVSAAVKMNATGPVLASSAVDAGPNNAGLVNGTPYVYFVTALFQDASGKAVEGTPTRSISVTPNPLIQPGGLSLFDFGTINPGSVKVDAKGVMTLRASGNDIWAGTDQGSFVAVPVTTDKDFMVTVKLPSKPVNDTDNTDGFAKIGLMVKYTLQPGSPYGLAFASVNRSPEFQFEARRSDNTTYGGGGGSPAQPTTLGAGYPYWLRLIVTSSSGTLNVEAQFSNDPAGADSSFKDITPVTDYGDLPPLVYVGIGSTAHHDGGHVLGTADLSTFTIVKM